MNAAATRPAALRRRWQPPERSGPAFGLSLLVHGALFIAIAFAVRWKTAEPVGAVSVELWGGLPPAAAPAPAPAPAPPPPVAAAPPPEPKPADIVEQKAEAPKKAPPKVEPVPPQKVEPPKKVEPLKKPEPAKKVEPARQPDPNEARREAEAKAAAAATEKQRLAALERMTAAAGSAPGAAAGVVAGGGFARGYEALVVGCIRPHIVFSVPEGMRAGQHIAEFRVSLLPTGEQVGAPKMLKSSGLPAFDQAVERAIRRCDPFPRPKEGAMPREVPLVFDPVETR